MLRLKAPAGEITPELYKVCGGVMYADPSCWASLLLICRVFCPVGPSSSGPPPPRTNQPTHPPTPQHKQLVDDLATKYGQNDIRATTRQCFQIHGILKGDLKTVIAALMNIGSSTVGVRGTVLRVCLPLTDGSCRHCRWTDRPDQSIHRLTALPPAQTHTRPTGLRRRGPQHQLHARALRAARVQVRGGVLQDLRGALQAPGM